MNVLHFFSLRGFDKVPLQMCRIKTHGVVVRILAWIEDWLTNRKKTCVVIGLFSGWKNVIIDVPLLDWCRGLLQHLCFTLMQLLRLELYSRNLQIYRFWPNTKVSGHPELG